MVGNASFCLLQLRFVTSVCKLVLLLFNYLKNSFCFFIIYLVIDFLSIKIMSWRKMIMILSVKNYYSDDCSYYSGDIHTDYLLPLVLVGVPIIILSKVPICRPIIILIIIQSI